MAFEFGAAAAAAATGSVGVGLFTYNRANYMYDQKQHYGRFTAGINMAIAQTGIYKQDIAQLTGLTVTRQDTYHGIAAMGLTILTAIYCPGRLGLHTPPPPGWLMGLAFVNIAGCYMFLGLTVWLAMHAAMRADTAATHMLTRFVRLPIPSQAMLDKARKFGASYEEQPLKEAFRIPFTSHQRAGFGKQGGFNEDMEMDAAAKRRTRHGFDVPAWYRKEKAIDNVSTIDSMGTMMPLGGAGEAPEHFEAYREIQNEWFPYDVYARLSIFLAFMHLTSCWAYMQIGHQLQENRALWACAIVLLPMFVLQQIILTLDIIPDSFPIHRVGPFGLWFAYIAAVIEYKRWFDADIQALGFFFVYIAYIIHVVYTLQLIRMCAPSAGAPTVAESPAASWWPGEWQLPSAFQHAIWLVAPPKKLQAGEHDIVGELRDAQSGGSKAAGAPASAAERRADVHRALGKQGESPAWFNVKVGLSCMVLAWLFLMFGFTIEIINQGTTHPSLMNALGMPNNARDPRYRPAKPGTHEPVEVGTGGAVAGPAKGVHMDAVHRRLQGASLSDLASGLLATAAERNNVAGKLRDLLPILQDLAKHGAFPATAPAVAEAVAAPSSLPVRWPTLFEPRVLAAGAAGRQVLALSRQGRGAIIDLAEQAAGGAATTAELTLLGTTGHGALLASAWDEHGLLLLTSRGAVLECPGAHSGGRWRCSPAAASAEASLPKSELAAVTRVGQGLRAAVLIEGENMVAFYQRGAGSSAWLPAGEVRVRGQDSAPVAASFSSTGEALWLTGRDGSVTELNMADGATSMVAPAVAGYDGHAWLATRLPTNSFIRLAISNAGTKEPKLLLD